jgi:outer membrane protein insertion porin family
MRMRFIAGLVLVLLLGLGSLATPGVFVRVAQAAVVSNVVINGNQRVEDETILSYMQLNQGDQFSDEAIDASISSSPYRKTRSSTS